MEPNNTPSDINIDTPSDIDNSDVLFDKVRNFHIDTPSDTIIDIPSDIDNQTGKGFLNDIKIDENSLNKNILKIRYLNGRKLNNELLKHDYKISKT